MPKVAIEADLDALVEACFKRRIMKQIKSIGLSLLSITLNIYSMDSSGSESGEKPLLVRPATTLKIDVSSPGPKTIPQQKMKSSQPQRVCQDTQLSSPGMSHDKPRHVKKSQAQELSPSFDATFNAGFSEGAFVSLVSPTPSNSPHQNSRRDPFAQLARSRVASDSPTAITNLVEQKKAAEGYISPLLSPSPRLFKRSPESNGSNGSFHRVKSDSNLHRCLKKKLHSLKLQKLTNLQEWLLY